MALLYVIPFRGKGRSKRKFSLKEWPQIEAPSHWISLHSQCFINGKEEGKSGARRELESRGGRRGFFSPSLPPSLPPSGLYFSFPFRPLLVSASQATNSVDNVSTNVKSEEEGKWEIPGRRWTSIFSRTFWSTSWSAWAKMGQLRSYGVIFPLLTPHWS